MFFEGQEQTSSIKCFYPPGGQSNFQFLYADAKPEISNFKKFPDTKTNYDILNLQYNGMNNAQINQRNCSIKTDYVYGKEKCNIFKNEFPDQLPQSSIKVTQMPGGNSRVRFASQQ